MATLACRIGDLATAIRDKFNQIMPRLLPAGGSTGQVLSKASNADNSFQWSTVTSGIPSVSADTAPTLGGVLSLQNFAVKATVPASGTQVIKTLPSANNGAHTLNLTARNFADSSDLVGIKITANGGSSGAIYYGALYHYIQKASLGTFTTIYTLPDTAPSTAGMVPTSASSTTSAMTWSTPAAGVGFTALGGLLNPSELIGRFHALQTFTIVPANCRVSADTAATASSVITIKKAGTSIGTATFAAGATTATISITNTAITKGDLITFHAPDTQDATLANVSGTISN